MRRTKSDKSVRKFSSLMSTKWDKGNDKTTLCTVGVKYFYFVVNVKRL